MHTLQTPKHKQSHTLQNPIIDKLAQSKINTYTQPHIRKPKHTHKHTLQTQNIDTHTKNFYNVHKHILISLQRTYTHTLQNENKHTLKH